MKIFLFIVAAIALVTLGIWLERRLLKKRHRNYRNLTKEAWVKARDFKSEIQKSLTARQVAILTENEPDHVFATKRPLASVRVMEIDGGVEIFIFQADFVPAGKYLVFNLRNFDGTGGPISEERFLQVAVNAALHEYDSQRMKRKLAAA